jgi:proline dehydrogenase
MLHKLLINTMPLVPRFVMRRMANKYIAGETLGEALAELTRQASAGHPGIFDILGEGCDSESHAREAAEAYCQGATAIAAAGLDAYVSIKPTHMGLDSSEDLAIELYSKVAKHCSELGVFMRVEMEDHPTTDATLRIFEELRKSFDRVGIVLQSRLFRTPDDIAKLAPGPLDVRLVKGIYLEPATVAHTDYEEIRNSFLAMARQLIERGDVTMRFATHDATMAQHLSQLIEVHKVPKDKYEYQVLLGVQQPLWKQWQDAGHTVRVYVPFGPEWREYSQRRLSKNPELLKAVMRDMLPF